MAGVEEPLDHELIERLARRLEALDEQAFEEILDRSIAKPQKEYTMAFRRPWLAYRSRATANKIVSRLNNSIHKLDPKRPEDKRRIETLSHQRTLVGYEGSILQHIVDNERLLAGGTLPTAPNPRSQADRELRRRHPVEYLDIVREKEEELKAKNKAAAKARRAQRVAERSGGARRR